MQPNNTPSGDQTELHKGIGTNETVVGGDVHVGGDNVHGDKIAGNKLTAGNRGVAANEIHESVVISGDGNVVDSSKTVIIQRLDPSDARNQRNHKMLRQMVRSFWVDGVLKSSLYNEVLIRLNLEERPNAVDNRPWDLILKQPGQSDCSIPPGTPIIDIFDRMNQLLLILGEPGSGKTTMLLELADALLKRAEADPTHPTPVIFNLSSWAKKRQPLSEWLIDELRAKYKIPKKVAKQWTADGELLLLLDGLDEVRQNSRDECVKAVNQFREEHLMSLAVCSRMAEYEDLATQLKLQGAVLVQPLNLFQIDEYLNAASHELSMVQIILKEDIEFQKVASSPLMLNIMMLAYHGMSVGELSAIDSSNDLQRHLFDAYVRRMFAHKGIPQVYIIKNTLYWLSWLANRLVQYGQTIFLIDRMQPSWAHTTRHSRFTISITMLMWGPMYGLIFGLAMALIVEFSQLLIFQTSFELSRILRDGLLVGLGAGLILGLSEGLTGRLRDIKLSDQPNELLQRLRSSLYSGLFWMLMSGLVIGIIYGLMEGLRAGLLSGLMGATVSRFRENKIANTFALSWNKQQDSLFSGLMIGLVISPIVGPIVGLCIGLLGGLLAGLIFEPSITTEISNTLATQTPNKSVKLSAVLTLSLFTGLSVWLVSGLLVWTVVGLRLALITGLSFGLLAVMAGGVIGGGDDAVKHLFLRLIIWWQGHIPWNYARFLDYCHSRIFLRKVGGGYIFIHRMLMEHFANMTDEDIERIAREVEAGR